VRLIDSDLSVFMAIEANTPTPPIKIRLGHVRVAS